MVKNLFILILLEHVGSMTCPIGYLDHHGASECIPEDFYYSSSTQQAAYFILDVTIEGSTVSNNDWVGAFNNDICVGARKWDTSQCGNGVCEVPVLGQDSQLTQGYMLTGVIPSFKIFRASDLSYLDAISSDDIPWSNFSTPIINSLSVACIGTVDECGLCNGPGSIYECGCFELSGDQCNCSGAIYDECGMCGGDGILEGECDCSGNVDSGCGCGVQGPTGCDNTCGSNAVIDECGVCDGNGIAEENCNCDGDILDCLGICGGNAALDNCDECDSDSSNNCDADCNGLFEGDIGYGSITDCLGVCGGSAFEDHCGICDTDDSNNNSDWDDDGICDNVDLCIGTEDDSGDCIVLEVAFPQTIMLKQNYPNPFNPITYLEFEIGEANHASLIIYDLNGNPIKKLIDRFLQTDSYRVSWDGRDESYNEVPSGIYIASLEYNYMISSTKLTLIK